MKVKVDLSNVPRKIKSICSNPKVGLFLASTCERYMNPYVPMDTGTLSQDTTVEQFRVTYNQPYAHRMFEGTNLNFNKEKHPLATAHWEKAMEVARKNDIATDVTNYIRKGGF